MYMTLIIILFVIVFVTGIITKRYEKQNITLGRWVIRWMLYIIGAGLAVAAFFALADIIFHVNW